MYIRLKVIFEKKTKKIEDTKIAIFKDEGPFYPYDVLIAESWTIFVVIHEEEVEIFQMTPIS